MKKRNLESVSASKRLNRSKTRIETFNIDLVNKENQEMVGFLFTDYIYFLEFYCLVK